MTSDANSEGRCRRMGEGERKQHYLHVGREESPPTDGSFGRSLLEEEKGWETKKLAGREWFVSFQ